MDIVPNKCWITMVLVWGYIKKSFEKTPIDFINSIKRAFLRIFQSLKRGAESLTFFIDLNGLFWYGGKIKKPVNHWFTGFFNYFKLFSAVWTGLEPRPPAWQTFITTSKIVHRYFYLAYILILNAHFLLFILNSILLYSTKTMHKLCTKLFITSL
jgi:hypothetical protein